MTDCLQLNANGLLEGSNGSTIPAEKSKPNESFIVACSLNEAKPAAEVKEEKSLPPRNKTPQRTTRSSTKSNKASKASRNHGGIKRVIKATESSRQVMRQVSGLGMFDPVFGEEKEVSNPQHPSYFFDDMDAQAIPEGMREVLSCCSDHTADENDGIDMELFSQSLGASHMSSFSSFSHGTLSLKSSESENPTKNPPHRSKAWSRQQSMTTRRKKAPSAQTNSQDWHASVTTLDMLSLEDTVEKSAENVKQRKKSSRKYAGVDGSDTAKLHPSKSRGPCSADKVTNHSKCTKKSAAKQNPDPASSDSPLQSQQEILLVADFSPVKHRELPICPEDIFGGNVNSHGSDTDNSNNNSDVVQSSGNRRLPQSPEKMFGTMAASMSQLDHLPDLSLFANLPTGCKKHEGAASENPSKDKRSQSVTHHSMRNGGDKASSPNRTRNESVSSKHQRHAKVQLHSPSKPTESYRSSTKKVTSQQESFGVSQSSQLPPKKHVSKQSISNLTQPQQLSSATPRQQVCNKVNEAAQTSSHSARIFGLGGAKSKFARLPSEHSFIMD